MDFQEKKIEHEKAIHSIYPSDAHPYYIVNTPFNHQSAGNAAMNMLCHSLNRHGYFARMLIYPDVPWKEEYVSHYLNAPLLTTFIAEKHYHDRQTPIVIYPEVISGNPFDAEVVVRYVLNIPGVLGGDKDYSDNELVFSYSRNLAQLTRFPDNILYLPPANNKIFYPSDQNVTRSGSCFYAHKYQHVFGGKLYNVTNNSIEITKGLPNSQSTNEVADLFRSVEVFYAYENTNLITEAIMCGCPVVLLFNPHFKSLFADSDTVVLNGVARGLGENEIKRAKDTVHLAYQDYMNDVRKFWKQLDDFIIKTQLHAAGKNYKKIIPLPHYIGTNTISCHLPQETIHKIAKEVMYEKQRWSIAYKFKSLIIKLLK